jgi:multiple antibiotic resistance protein
MAMDIKHFFSMFFAFLALVNPLQKLFVVMTLQESYDKNELRKIINRSNRTALEVLIIFLFAGELILGYVFNLQTYAFQATCGFVLLYNGFMGLQKGAFLNFDRKTRIEDIIAVPIAVPMIAGPATITAAVTMPSIYGKGISAAAIVLAIIINWLIMRNTALIAKFLAKYNILMPLIRIVGLIVAAIGTQMIFNAIKTFIAN